MYYSLSDILAGEEKVPCKFSIHAYNLGRYIDREDTEEDVKQGEIISLPFWLVEKLYDNNTIDIVLPKKIYGPKMRNRLFADAYVVSLGAYAYYFQIGFKLLEMVEGDELDYLLPSYVNRMLYIMDLAFNILDQDVNNILAKFTARETYLFRRGYEISHLYDMWRRKGSLIEEEMVFKQVKRMRLQQSKQS